MKAVIFFVRLDLFSLTASFITPLERKSVNKNNTSIKNISRKKQLITTALQLYSLVVCCQISASSPQGMNTKIKNKTFVSPANKLKSFVYKNLRYCQRFEGHST